MRIWFLIYLWQTQYSTSITPSSTGFGISGSNGTLKLGLRHIAGITSGILWRWQSFQTRSKCNLGRRRSKLTKLWIQRANFSAIDTENLQSRYFIAMRQPSSSKSLQSLYFARDGARDGARLSRRLNEQGFEKQLPSAALWRPLLATGS